MNPQPDRFSASVIQPSFLAQAISPHISTLALEDVCRKTASSACNDGTLFKCIILVTDIANFTSLTERLEHSGPSGVESLSRVINGCFAHLINLVEAHGGHLVTFAGDALIFLWHQDGESIERTAHRAAQCALQLNSLRVQTSPKEAQLSVRVGIALGEAVHMILGGKSGIWIPRLAGPAVSEAFKASRYAAPGQVSVSRSASLLLHSCADSFPISDDYSGLRAVASLTPRSLIRPAIAVEDVEQLSGFVPHAILQRIALGHQDWIAEFRTVSVIFIQIPGSSEENLSFVRSQTVVHKAQDLLELYNGSLHNLSDDQPSLTLVAAFGLPMHAHDDDAARAVRFALSISSHLHSLGWKSGIAVTTGRMYCGILGAPQRHAYSLLGTPMNLCSRLAAIADGNVLCDDTTRRAAEKWMRFDFVKEAALKGKSQTHRIFRPVGPCSPAVPSRRLVWGRELEKTQLKNIVTNLRNGCSGGFVLIEGEAGIGKSTLLSDLLGTAAELNIRFLSGTGDSFTHTSSYHPWRRIFHTLFPPEDSHSKAAPSQKLSRTLQQHPKGGSLAPLLNTPLGLNLPETEITAQLTGRARAEATRDLLSHLLVSATQADPILLVLDDAHLADSESLEFSLYLSRKVPNLLQVLAARPSAASVPELWETVRDTVVSHHTHIPLGALEEPALRELVQDKLQATELPPEILQMIRSTSGGNPFFSEQLAQMLLESGFVTVDSGTCLITPSFKALPLLSLPLTVQAAVNQRLDRRPARESLAVKVASILGNQFSFAALHSIHPVADDLVHLAASLENLVTAGLLLKSRSLEGDHFFFKHQIIREVAYGQLPFSQRKYLHQGFAEFLEQVEPLNHPVLAHHWLKTDSLSRAISHLDLAATQALTRHANAEAVEFLTNAIQTALNIQEKQDRYRFGRWHRQLGEAYHRLGRMEQSRKCLADSLRILQHPVPSPSRIRLYGLLKETAIQCWRQVTGHFPTPASGRVAEELAEAIRADNALAEIAFFTDDLLTSVFHVLHGLNLAEALGPSDQKVEMYAAVMLLTSAMPLQSIGDRYFAQTESALDRPVHPVSLAYVRQLMGVFLNGRGRFALSFRMLEDAVHTFDRFGNRRRLEECWVNIFYLHLYRGELATAKSSLRLLQDSASDRQDPQTMGWAVALEAHLLLALNGPNAVLERLARLPSPEWDRLTHAAFHSNLAAAHFRSGNMGAAREHAVQVLESLARTPPVSYTSLLDYSHTAEVFLGLLSRADPNSPSADLSRNAHRACKAMRAFGSAFPIGQIRAQLWSGTEAWINGSKQKALRLWERSLSAALHLDLPEEIAFIKSHRSSLESAKSRLPE